MTTAIATIVTRYYPRSERVKVWWGPDMRRVPGSPDATDVAIKEAMSSMGWSVTSLEFDYQGEQDTEVWTAHLALIAGVSR